MSEEKRLEIEIGWYKVVFAILVATDIWASRLTPDSFWQRQVFQIKA